MARLIENNHSFIKETRMKKILLPIIIAVSVLTTFTTHAAEMMDSKHNWNSPMSATAKAIKDAKSENKKAKKVGFEWRDTGKMIKKANKLAKAGKKGKAVKLANKAKRQAINAQHQALTAKGAGPHLF